MESRRLRAEITNCSSIASDSPTGTSRPSAQVGVPMASSNHASTNLGFGRALPTPVRFSDTTCYAVVVRLLAARGFGQIAAHLRQFVVLDEERVELGEAGHRKRIAAAPESVSRRSTETRRA